MTPLPFELVQETLRYVQDTKDIKNYRLVCRSWYAIGQKSITMHVKIDDRSRSQEFIHALTQFPDLKTRVIKLSFTTSDIDLDLFTDIINQCSSLNILQFGEGVEMTKYFRKLYSNTIKLPHIKHIRIPRQQAVQNRMFVLGTYYRFRSTISILELHIDSSIILNLRSNYGGLDAFIGSFGCLKSVKLDYTGACTMLESLHEADLPKLFSRFRSNLNRIVLDGVGELHIKHIGPTDRNRSTGMEEISIKTPVPDDIDSLLFLLTSLRRSNISFIIDNIKLYSSLNLAAQKVEAIHSIMCGFRAYYIDNPQFANINIGDHKPKLVLNQNNETLSHWTLVTTANNPQSYEWSAYKTIDVSPMMVE